MFFLKKIGIIQQCLIYSYATYGGIVINTINSFFSGLDYSILINVVAALICITLHELSHGFVAYKLGDNTAKNAGRLTLNPIKHIDIIGLIMMAIFKFGWAKPVPINMGNFKNPKTGMAITALAGPVSNVIIAAFMFLVYGLIYKSLNNSSGVGAIILQLVYTTAYISCALAVLNIIPIPPLDGSKVLFSFLPNDIYYKLMRYEQYGFILLILLISTNAASPFLSNATQGLFNFLSPIAQWAYLQTV